MPSQGKGALYASGDQACKDVIMYNPRYSFLFLFIAIYILATAVFAANLPSIDIKDDDTCRKFYKAFFEGNGVTNGADIDAPMQKIISEKANALALTCHSAHIMFVFNERGQLVGVAGKDNKWVYEPFEGSTDEMQIKALLAEIDTLSDIVNSQREIVVHYSDQLSRVPKQLLRPKAGSCYQLDRVCLAEMAGKEFAKVAGVGRAYVMRDIIADLASLYQDVGLEAAELMPHLEKLDPTYRVEAIAELVNFGDASTLEERLQQELQKFSKGQKWQFESALASVAAVEAAAGNYSQAAKRLEALEKPERAVQALIYLAYNQLQTGNVDKAISDTRKVLSLTKGQRPNYEIIRQIFRIIEQLAVFDRINDAQSIAETFHEEKDRIVALAYVGKGSGDSKKIASVLKNAMALKRDKNYILEEISIMAAEMGNSSLVAQAINAMEKQHNRQAPVLAWARFAKTTKQAEYIKRAEGALSNIPSKATYAVADAQIAIAEAQAALGDAKQAWQIVMRLEPLEYRVKGMVRLAGVRSQRYP